MLLAQQVLEAPAKLAISSLGDLNLLPTKRPKAPL